MSSQFVQAYDTVTGAKRLVPESWLGQKHPQFARFAKTPRQRRADRGQSPAPEPVTQESPQEPVASNTENEED